MWFTLRRHKGPSKARKFSYRFSRFPHFGYGFCLDFCAFACSERGLSRRVALYSNQRHLFPLLSDGRTPPRCLCTKDWLGLAAHHGSPLLSLCAGNTLGHASGVEYMEPFTVVSLWGDSKQAEVDSIHRLSRSDTRRKSFRHNFRHMIWIQTGKGLSSKHPN